MVKFLKTRFTSGDRIVAPHEIVYYLRATNTGFIYHPRKDLETPEKFIRLQESYSEFTKLYL